MGGQSGSWTPTKRRGPIAAEFQGPGPAALSLPALFGSEFYYLHSLNPKNTQHAHTIYVCISILIFTRNQLASNFKFKCHI